MHACATHGYIESTCNQAPAVNTAPNYAHLAQVECPPNQPLAICLNAAACLRQIGAIARGRKETTDRIQGGLLGSAIKGGAPATHLEMAR